ncbi:hypothetical protein [Psychrobacter sp. GP33]|uniref:hypothetical protein n=1 Tax=Psychrobacter sp. GP33 TaxID=2758709 RepID=UPI0015FC9AF9|nr:hypothetical protein [Psychrobacter sp. GP33]
MKALFKLAGSTALVMGMLGAGTVTAQAATQTGDLHYSADCGVKELRMDKGRYDINRAGAVKGSNYCEYYFYAKKGQKVSATIIGSDDLYPVLYSTNSPDLSTQTVTLDKTGKHTIRVLQPRNQARDGNTPKPYYLTVTIK